MNLDVTLSLEGTAVKIRINGTLHLCFKYAALLGFHSWISGNDPFKSYWLEIVLKGNKIVLGYDDREKWEKVLAALDGANLYSDLAENL